MVLTNQIGIFEWTLVALGGLLYLSYLVRVFRISRALHSPAHSVIYKLVWRTLYFALFIIALLGVSFGQSQREIKDMGKDIMLAVDLSKSMDATDLSPSRLTKLKYELRNLVKTLEGNRIGLVVFTDNAFMQSPLTSDASALNLFISTLSSGLVTSTGTNFAPALRMAREKLLSAQQDAPEGRKGRSAQVVILASDGEDFGEGTEEAAKQLASDGIKVFTLGVGTEGGGNIPEGYGKKRDMQGTEILTRLNRNSLQSVADAAGGQYFELSDRRNDIKRMATVIEGLKGEVRGTRMTNVSTNRYYYFLGAALLLMLLDSLFHIKLFRL